MINWLRHGGVSTNVQLAAVQLCSCQLWARVYLSGVGWGWLGACGVVGRRWGRLILGPEMGMLISTAPAPVPAYSSS